MSGSRDAAQLRAVLSRYREQKRYGRYPSELAERAAAYARERSRSGATAPEIAAELGVHAATANRWASGREPSVVGLAPSTPKAVEGFPLVPVLVRPERREVRAMRIKLAFADGTRMQVSGLSGRELSEALEALRRPR
jgi:predicted transcriptional regulator